MSTTATQADVVIVGGGMVGATLACALGDTPLKVVLLEAGSGQYEIPQEGFELRVSAITRASQRIFETLAYGQVLLPVASVPIVICMSGMQRVLERFISIVQNSVKRL